MSDLKAVTPQDVDRIAQSDRRLAEHTDQPIAGDRAFGLGFQPTGQAYVKSHTEQLDDLMRGLL